MERQSACRDSSPLNRPTQIHRSRLPERETERETERDRDREIGETERDRETGTEKRRERQ